MHTHILFTVLAAFLLASTPVFAAEGSVTISAPANGAMVGAKDKLMLSYAAVPGPDGDHLHLYLDGKRIDVIHQLKGNAEVGTLSPGKHHICLEVNTKAHVPTGAESCIDVTSK